MSKRPRIVAHRGYSARCPESTLAAFRAACDLGVDAVELDVRRTKDGEIIVLHDVVLDRTTDGAGPVGGYSGTELQRFSAGAWFGAAFQQERIPRLEDALVLVRGRADLIIEIKETGIEEEVVRLIRNANMAGSVVCGSFNRDSVFAVRALASEIPTCLIAVSCEDRDPAALVQAGVRGINIEYHHLSVELLKRLHSLGLTVNAWTVDDPADMAKLAAMGVDAITTNDPAKLKQLLEDMSHE